MLTPHCSAHASDVSLHLGGIERGDGGSRAIRGDRPTRRAAPGASYPGRVIAHLAVAHAVHRFAPMRSRAVPPLLVMKSTARPPRPPARADFDPRVIRYIAHADSAALLLDEDGICRASVLKKHGRARAPRAEELERCVGAQYVASLDPHAEGLLAHEPEVGKRALFAQVERGRIVVFRFGPLVDFEHVEHSMAARVPAPRARDDASDPTLDDHVELTLDDASDPTLEMVGRGLEDLFEADSAPDLVTSIDVTAWAPVRPAPLRTAPRRRATLLPDRSRG